MSQEHTRKDSEQICKAVCRLPARIAEVVYQVSPSRVCTTRQSVQQAVKLPVRFKQSEENLVCGRDYHSGAREDIPAQS